MEIEDADEELTEIFPDIHKLVWNAVSFFFRWNDVVHLTNAAEVDAHKRCVFPGLSLLRCLALKNCYRKFSAYPMRIHAVSTTCRAFD